MDRRRFLTTSGALGGAVLAGGAAPGAATPTSVGGRDAPLLIAVGAQGTDPLAHDALRRLTQRITMLTAGRLSFVTAPAGPGRATADGAAQAYFGSGLEHAAAAPALSYFLGLPGRQGLSPAALKAWLAAGGGQALWDDYLASFDLKPLLVGLTGSSGGLWSTATLADDGRMAGLRIATDGLAVDIAVKLGAAIAGPDAADLVEAASPLSAIARGLPARFKHVARDGIASYGAGLMLAIERQTWDRLSAADRLAIESAAAEELRLVEAEAVAHTELAWRTAAAQGVVIGRLPDRLAAAVDDATADLLRDAAAADPCVARIQASYAAFQRLVGCDPLAA